MLLLKRQKMQEPVQELLRMILENLLRDLMFEVPSDDTIMEIHIEEGTIINKQPPLVIRRNDQKIA